CDATGDDSSTTAGSINIYFIFCLIINRADWVDFCGLTGYICQPRSRAKVKYSSGICFPETGLRPSS
ncbi:MAG TPA: hypothetical protein VKB95_13630, partial [Chitinophagaceae bacterium]|nr:hypothetical protein [Chitinophagaceae bacterium]